jgi:hypothetical protein
MFKDCEIHHLSIYRKGSKQVKQESERRRTVRIASEQEGISKICLGRRFRQRFVVSVFQQPTMPFFFKTSEGQGGRRGWREAA